MNESRVSAGSPAGGQFATRTRDEAVIDLADLDRRTMSPAMECAVYGHVAVAIELGYCSRCMEDVARGEPNVFDEIDDPAVRAALFLSGEGLADAAGDAPTPSAETAQEAAGRLVRERAAESADLIRNRHF